MSKKVLVVYYSLQGYTRKVAEMIQNAVEGDSFEIQLEKPYNLVTAYTIGILHCSNGHTPALKNQMTNVQDYDVILIGSPVWAFTMSPAMLSFLKTHDLAGKTVIPFCTHGGNMGKYFDNFAQNCANANIAQGKDFRNVKSADKTVLAQEIEDWVKELSL
ncbi:MAG: NAD(P)H-dependent oxidoreductase [Clostridiales bacterium]|nr:NAD(P)H-dependent oxidoreductase [Clostridiales bacterium]